MSSALIFQDKIQPATRQQEAGATGNRRIDAITGDFNGDSADDLILEYRRPHYSSRVRDQTGLGVHFDAIDLS